MGTCYKFDKGMSQFLPFLVVYHILSETGTRPFLRFLRMNSSEMQYTSTQNERFEIGCYYYNRPNGASFKGEYLRHKTRSNKVNARRNLRYRGPACDVLSRKYGGLL